MPLRSRRATPLGVAAQGGCPTFYLIQIIREPSQASKWPASRRPYVEDGDYLVAPNGDRFHVRRVDWPKSKADAANVAANSPFIAGAWTPDVIVRLDEIKVEMPELFGELRLDVLAKDVAGLKGKGEIQEDPIPDPPKKAITKKGDLWILGRHRLLCGDATNEEDVAKVMIGKKADMVFTDPPYGINVVKSRSVGGDGPIGGKKNYKATIGGDNIVKANRYEPIRGDDKPFDPRFLLQLAKEQIIFGGNYFASKLPDSRGWFVWDKIDGMVGTTKNFSDFEMGWTSFNVPARLFHHRWQGLMKGSEKNENRCHPTQKPVVLCAEIIEHYDNNAVIILDPFLGSGTTLIAAEQLGRKCYGLEIEPKYCDVIVERWQNLTGEKAKRE